MRLRGWTISAAPLWLAAGVAFAQGGDIDLKKGAKLSPSETMSQSRDYLQKMQDTQKRITGLQDKAKKAKDVVKLNCVNDKLTQCKGHVAVASQSLAALNDFITRGDDGGRQHEFLRIEILFQKVLVLGTEAENCIGEDVSYVGETKNEVEIDPSIPAEDPTQPQLPLPDVTRPPAATPIG